MDSPVCVFFPNWIHFVFLVCTYTLVKFLIEFNNKFQGVINCVIIIIVARVAVILVCCLLVMYRTSQKPTFLIHDVSFTVINFVSLA